MPAILEEIEIYRHGAVILQALYSHSDKRTPGLNIECFS